MAALVVGVCVGWLLVQGMAAPSAESAAGQTIPTVTPATHNLPLIVYNPATPTPVCLPSPPLPSSDSANRARIAAGIQQQRSAAGLALLQSQTTTITAMVYGSIMLPLRRMAPKVPPMP
ncbi:MAG: hypothetical protein M9965_14145 [Anaerolineae bacterium]|nr:hypothetical protein [Anaerolineae bacterium]